MRSSQTADRGREQGRWVLPIIVLVVVGGVVLSSLLGTNRGIDGPVTDATIVAQLGSYQKPFPDELRQAARVARAHPDDVAAVIKAARAYIAYGQSVGDARLVGTALGFLEPFLKAARPDPEVLVVAATALQYNHDFARALALLDQALARVPGYDEAQLIHADIDIVQGRLAEALPECQVLASDLRVDLALICEATARALTADADVAATRLRDLMALPRQMDPNLRNYATELLGEIALFRGQRDQARADLSQAIAAQPSDLRSMMVFADFLLHEQDPGRALAVMANAPPTDGILIRRAIAYRDLGDTASVEPIREALLRTFDLQRQLGLSLHAREEARFLLEIQNDPSAALDRAAANWTSQREFEDAQLYLDAASAAGSPMAAKPVLDWMRAEGVDAPALRIPDALKAVTP